jgi:hypothetical protein
MTQHSFDKQNVLRLSSDIHLKLTSDRAFDKLKQNWKGNVPGWNRKMSRKSVMMHGVTEREAMQFSHERLKIDNERRNS